MKGLSIKKLAAVAAGAALIGTAVAPVAMALQGGPLVKSDLFNDNGTPKASVILGSGAQPSDGVWAGNIAAAIAEQARTLKTVSVSGESGTGSEGSVDVSDVSVDLVIGGKTIYKTGSKSYDVPLRSGTGVEILANDSGDTNTLSDAQLTNLYNKAKAQRVDNNTTTPTNSERMGVKADAKMDTTQDIKDLVAYVEGGDFYYKINLNGTTGIDLGTTAFTDSGTDDVVKIPFFGTEYSLSQATLTGTNYVKLVKESAVEQYNAGDTITGLVGDNSLAGQEVSVKVVAVVASGPAAATYKATVELYDAEGKLVDTRTVSVADNLKSIFVDSSDNFALKSNLNIDSITVDSQTLVGVVQVTKGTDTLEMYDGKGYPYDPNDTTGVYDYTVSITSSGTKLQNIKISNSRDKWNNSSSSNGPLYPTAAGQSLTGKPTDKEAIFGNALADGTAGKGYARVSFEGFKTDQERSQVEIGKVAGLPTDSIGGLKYKSADDASHTIPMAFKIGWSDTPSSFSFDGQTVWYDLNLVTGTGSDGTAGTSDLNFIVKSGDYVNGRQWTIAWGAQMIPGIGDLNLSIGGGSYNNAGYGNPSATQLRDSNVFTVDDVNFTVRDANYLGTNNTAIISAHGSLELRRSSNTGTQLYNTSGDSTDQTYGKFYFNDDTVFDGNIVGGSALLLQDSRASAGKGVYYSINPARTLSRFWFMLRGQHFGAGESQLIENNKVLQFRGTFVPPNDGTYTESIGATPDHNFFVPQSTDYNSNANFSASNAYYVAEFHTNDQLTGTQDTNVFIDTRDGGLIGPFPNTNLAAPTFDAKYFGVPVVTLTSGTQSNYLQAGYTDNGTKLWLNGNDSALVSMVQAIENVILYVVGQGVEAEVTGEELSVKVGESGTTSAGTIINVSAVNGATCSGGETSAGTCAATPDKYFEPAAVGNLVYLDTDRPSGKLILVGGHFVNKMTEQIPNIADVLTAPGDGTEAWVDSDTGYVVVAGYTADDTVAAAKDLISAIEGIDMSA
jgi:hypothetical protein